MYRYLVLFLVGGAMLIGAYYVREAGVEKVFSYIPSNGDAETLTPDDVSGKYLCDVSDGCKIPYEVTLYLNSGAKFTQLEGALNPEVVERGNWNFINGGLISLTLTGKDDEDYTKPVTILIQSVGTSSLTKFVYNAKQYPFISKPRFVKEDL